MKILGVDKDWITAPTKGKRKCGPGRRSRLRNAIDTN